VGHYSTLCFQTVLALPVGRERDDLEKYIYGLEKERDAKV
jgi:hypothetical protein